MVLIARSDDAKNLFGGPYGVKIQNLLPIENLLFSPYLSTIYVMRKKGVYSVYLLVVHTYVQTLPKTKLTLSESMFFLLFFQICELVELAIFPKRT